jgi:hypothetical protein
MERVFLTLIVARVGSTISDPAVTRIFLRLGCRARRPYGTSIEYKNACVRPDVAETSDCQPAKLHREMIA